MGNKLPILPGFHSTMNIRSLTVAARLHQSLAVALNDTVQGLSGGGEGVDFFGDGGVVD